MLQGIQAQLAATSAANSATSMAVLPAGAEGASALAMAKHQATAADFAAQFELGLEQMIELSSTIQSASAAHVITDVGSAAAF
ncbi:MAG: hypothetical protein PHQ28_00045 [Mycobacterium sp.]|nr:hypothetical protein [Mycobacterium sp.]